jgi:hypothetical protein
MVPAMLQKMLSEWKLPHNYEGKGLTNNLATSVADT